MKLGEKRKLFTLMLPRLIDYINQQPGYSCYLGDGKTEDLNEVVLLLDNIKYDGSLNGLRKSVHCKNSLHYLGLAQDINLFKNGWYCVKTSDHKPFGDYWKSLHPMNTWGGDFKRQDGNHYSFGEGR